MRTIWSTARTTLAVTVIISLLVLATPMFGVVAAEPSPEPSPSSPQDLVQFECVPLSGLVSWWAAEGDADDRMGVNNGVLEGGTTFTAGRVDRAFNLDGIDDAVNVGNDPSLHVSGGNFSIVGWVWFSELSHPPGENAFGAPPGDMSIVDKMSPVAVNVDGWRLIKQDDNRFWFCLGGGGTENGCGDLPTGILSKTVAEANRWYHVAVVKNSTTFSIYINGNRETSKPTPVFEDTHSANMRIGANELEGAHLNGIIDEVGLFNRALAPGEIQRIYLNGRSGGCPPPRP